MPEALLRVDPAQISTTLKEGVVDALVNLTFQRISGHGVDGEVVYGCRPRSSFCSAFLLPRPLTVGESDEVTQPIQISAHGLDFQIHRLANSQILVSPQLQVYVRVLPNLADMKRPECMLRFRLNDLTRNHLKDVLFAALNDKWKEIGAGYKRRFEHPEWKKVESEVRERVHRELGLPKDLKTLFLDEGSAADNDEGRDEKSDEGVVVGDDAAPGLNDKHFQPMDIPHKWMRVPMNLEALPKLVIDPNATKAELMANCAQAASELNTAIANTLTAWATSQDGKDWGYRADVKVYPSDFKGWEAFLTKIRLTDKAIAVPLIDVGWDARVTTDWMHPTQANVHVSLENRSKPPTKNWDETDEALFQVDLLSCWVFRATVTGHSGGS